MADLEKYQLLCNLLERLNTVNISSTNHVANVRSLIKKIKELKDDILTNSLELSQEELNELMTAVEDAETGREISFITNIQTSASIKTFQLGGTSDDVNLKFKENSLIAPEHGTILQKLWKVGFNESQATGPATGYAIVSDTSDVELSTLFNANLSTALLDSPSGAVEDLNITISLQELRTIIETNNSRDVSDLFNNLEKPAPIARQLRDIDIDADPSLSGLTEEQKTDLKTAVNTLNSEETPEAFDNLQTVATSVGLFSTSLGAIANLNYSDLKRFKLQKETELVDVVASIPVVSWSDSPIAGIPLRDENGPKNKTNRKDEGTSYIVDLGGKDPVIRQGAPNPLPATRYYNFGPNGATETEGAMDRYGGGKCLGLNTTDEEVSFQTVHYETEGEITLTIPPLTAMWQLDRSTFDGSNNHAYYTVFSASRPPPAGFMGVVFAPKQNRLGRGRGEIASGVSLANGISTTGKTFNVQNSDGAVLDNGEEVPSGLKGLTCDFDGHGIHPADMLKFMQDNSFTKGEQYLTIPADATLETVEDVLIPAGQFVPQITTAIATLMQFVNGTYIQDGGPNRFQSGLIPFLPGTPAYTPEWHINWIAYNCGEVECDGETYPVENIAKDGNPESWVKPDRNISFAPPPPNTANDKETKYSPAHPDTFDPVQYRCQVKSVDCTDYVNRIEGSKHGEITLSMLPQLESENKIFFSEAPAGAMRGWVKFLVVNCPLPIIATIKVEGEEVVQVNSSSNNGGFDVSKCKTCACERDATTVSINGDLNPIWLDENVDGEDTVINERVLKFKVGDNIVIRSTTGTVHGVSLRLDGIGIHKTVGDNLDLDAIQSEVLEEIKSKIDINNDGDLESNLVALTDEVIAFHDGIPITFAQKATTNPVNFPDGVIITDLTVKEGSEGTTGTVSCTVHGVSMSFRFEVC
jgi:hypothetical protein